jgi:hypothetical protein
VAIDQATGAETSLEPVTLDGSLNWSQAFVVPADAVHVRVSFSQTTRSLWLWLQLIVFIALVILALPARRVDEIDPDIEGSGFSAEAVRHE